MAPSPDTAQVSPSHVVALSDTWRIDGVLLSPDGQTVYVQFQDSVLNPWSVAAHFWPYLLGIVLAVMLLVCLWILVRVSRRPQVPGHPHCRRCNYDLSGTDDRPCAECGLDPTSRAPTLGRSRVRRLAPCLSILVVAMLAYATLYVLRGRWEPSAAHWIRTDMPAARTPAMLARAPWLAAFVRNEARIGAFDGGTGALTRVIAYTGSTMQGPLSLSADGSVLVYQDERGGLVAIDPRNASVIGLAPRPDGAVGLGSPYSPGWRHVAGFGTQSSTVLVQFFDDKKLTNTLYQWDLHPHRLTPLLTLDAKAPTTTFGGGTVRRFYVLEGTSPRLLAEVPDGYVEGLTYGQISEIVIRNLDDSCRELRTIRDAFWAGARPHVDPTRSVIFTRHWRSSTDIGMLDLETGSMLGGLKAPGFMGTMENGLNFHQPTGLLFVAGTSPCAISVRDTTSKEWIARLQFPTDGLSPNEFAVSADGRRIAAEYTDTGPPGARLSRATPTPASAVAAAAAFRNKLVIFDLPFTPAIRPPEATPNRSPEGNGANP